MGSQAPPAAAVEMTSAITLGFGPATVQVKAEQPYSDVLESLAEWIEHRPSEQDESPDVRIVLSSGRVAPAIADIGWWDGKAWDAVPSRDEASGMLLWRVFLHEAPFVRATRIVPDVAIRWAHVLGFGRAQILANAVLYGHVLPAAQEALRNCNATLVHASAVASVDGDAVLVLGRGGAGKTSASTQLYIRKPDRWRYMSDDLAVLAADGTLYRSPVPLNIFPYNTQRFPELWSLLTSTMSPMDRLQWQVRRTIFGVGGAARRLPPFEKYLGPATARVRQVVELARVDVPLPVTQTADSARVAREARDVLMHELRRGFNGISRWRAETGPKSMALPDPSAALDDAERVMRSAFCSARLHRIAVPLLAPPDEVGAVVERTISAA